MSEHRLTFRLLSYWNRIREERDFPPLSEINIIEIKEIWALSFVIDVTNDEPIFQYFGSDLVDVFGNDYTAEYLNNSLENNSILENALGFYDKVTISRKPELEAASFFLEEKEVKYRSIIVPLGTDGEIEYLFGTTNYKIF